MLNDIYHTWHGADLFFPFMMMKDTGSEVLYCGYSNIVLTFSSITSFTRHHLERFWFKERNNFKVFSRNYLHDL